MAKKEVDEFSIRGRAQAEMKNAKESMKDMNGRQKAEYIFMYYKWPIIIAAVVIIIVISVCVASSRHKEYAFTANLIAGRTTNADEIMENDMANLLQIDAKKEQVLIDSSINFSDVSYASIGGTEKLASELSTGMLDVCIMPEETFAEYEAEDMYAPLTEVFDDDMITELDNEGLIWYDDEGVAKGIYVADLPEIKENGIYDAEDAPVFGIANTSTRKDTAKTFYEYLAE